MPPHVGQALNTYHAWGAGAPKTYPFLQDALNDLRGTAKDWHRRSQDPGQYSGYTLEDAERYQAADAQVAKNYSDAADWLEQNHHRLGFRPPGNMYQVWIHPEEHEMLHLDSDWQYQPPAVQQIIRMKFPKVARIADEQSQYRGFTGDEIYRELANQHRPSGYTEKSSEQWASEQLDRYGIPGLRFLDAGSRHLPRQLYLGDKPFQLGERPGADRLDPENFIATELQAHTGPQPRSMWRIHNDLETIRSTLQHESDTGYPATAMTHAPGRGADQLALTRAGLDWIDKNRDKFRMGDHPDTTYNYVMFHPRHMHIIDRNGQLFGLEKTPHNPFTGEPLP
jgi:hypothetical protein